MQYFQVPNCMYICLKNAIGVASALHIAIENNSCSPASPA